MPYDLNRMTSTGIIKQATRGRISIRWEGFGFLRHRPNGMKEIYLFLWGEHPIGFAGNPAYVLMGEQ